MKKIILSLAITLAAILLSGVLPAQSQNVDSLINVLNTRKPNPDELYALYSKVCDTYLPSDIEKNIVYLKRGLLFAEKEKDKSLASEYNRDIARSYNNWEKNDTAMMYFNAAIDLAIEANDKDKESTLYANIANIYGVQANYDRALEYLLKALSIAESTGNKLQCGRVLSNIGSIHRMLKNYDRAIDYLNQGRVIVEEINNSYGMMTAYYDLGAIYRMKNDFKKALDYALKANNISRTINDTQYEIISGSLLANVYMEGFEDYDKALEYTNKNLHHAEEFGDTRLIISSLSELSFIYLNQERYKDCEAAAYKAWELDSINTDRGRNIAANLTMANIYLNNKDKATYFFNKFGEIMERHFHESYTKTFSEMEVKYETEKKELRITALEKEKTLYIWLSVAGGALLLSLLLLFILRHRLAKQRVKQLEQEKQIIAVQSVLEGETEERKRVAGELHDSLGAMLSVVKLNLDDVEHLQNARDLLDQSISELRRIAHRMMPESLLRYGLKVSLEDFCLSVPAVKFHYYGDDSRLDNKMELLIYRCVHELVNNSIKYSGADVINVQLVQDADRISLTVQDNGCGFDTEAPAHGMGLKNLRDRIAAYGGKITIYSEQGKGTEVYVECLASTLTLV